MSALYRLVQFDWSSVEILDLGAIWCDRDYWGPCLQWWLMILAQRGAMIFLILVMVLVSIALLPHLLLDVGYVGAVSSDLGFSNSGLKSRIGLLAMMIGSSFPRLGWHRSMTCYPILWILD